MIVEIDSKRRKRFYLKCDIAGCTWHTVLLFKTEAREHIHGWRCPSHTGTP